MLAVRLPRRARELTIAALMMSLIGSPALAQAPWEGEWKPWPEDYPSFEYSREELLERWDDLHQRDGVPRPTAEYVREMSTDEPEDAEAVAEQLLDGWRHFHAGDFQQAHEIGEQAGRPGEFLAGAAWVYYASHMLDGDERVEMLSEGVSRVADQLENSEPPLTYWERAGVALMYGQYAKVISSTRSTREGIPTIVRELVESSLEEKSDHPAALGIFGGFHTEVVDRVGGMLARITYGARRDEAPKYFERSLEVDPELIQARVEYGEALLRLWGEDRADEARKQLSRALATEPLNSVDYLEQVRARSIAELYKLDIDEQ